MPYAFKGGSIFLYYPHQDINNTIGPSTPSPSTLGLGGISVRRYNHNIFIIIIMIIVTE